MIDSPIDSGGAALLAEMLAVMASLAAAPALPSQPVGLRMAPGPAKAVPRVVRAAAPLPSRVITQRTSAVDPDTWRAELAERRRKDSLDRKLQRTREHVAASRAHMSIQTTQP